MKIVKLIKGVFNSRIQKERIETLKQPDKYESIPSIEDSTVKDNAIKEMSAKEGGIAEHNEPQISEISKEDSKSDVLTEKTSECFLKERGKEEIKINIDNVSSTLNTEQRDAVCFNGKHLLVLAGAGTGKTRTIIERAKVLINSGVKPNRIMILSFTRKSAREITNRIKISFGNGEANGLIGQTFHSWCMSIIKNNRNIFPQSDFTLIDEEDRESCVKLIAGRGFKKNTGVSPKSVLEVYSYAINTQCSLSEAMKEKLYSNWQNLEDIPHIEQKRINLNIKKKIEKEKPVFEKLIQSYIAYKEEHKYIDYDDILCIVSKALKQYENVRKYISSKYDHILVDEMQDTNPLQYELLSSFYERCHLFCVGDDAQSIYAFRGADFKSIHSFHENVKDSVVKKLTINYRSTKEILDLCNWIINQSPLKYDKDLVSVKGSGKLPTILHWDDEWEEADDITDKIMKSVSEEGFKFSDNMVLSKSIKGLRRVESACMEKKIPYTIFGGIGLMKSKHIRDVASALRIVSNYKDEIAWNRYLQIWKGIGDVKAANIINEVIPQNDFTECLHKLKDMNLQSEIYATLYSVKDNQTNVPRSIETALKYMTTRLKELYGDEWMWRVNDFKILMDVASNTGSISEFVAEYVLDPKLELTIKNGHEENDCVVLSTIHSAKGLEAENCYITNVSTFAYPSIRAINNGVDDIEEERRCLYVAATRAKSELFIYRDIISVHASESDKELNNYYFLNDIPVELIKYEDIERNKAVCKTEMYNEGRIEVKTDFNFD